MEENNQIAKAAFNLLGIDLSEYQMAQALSANPPCRLEPVPEELRKGKQNIWLDIGHNEAAIEKALSTLSDLHPGI